MHAVYVVLHSNTHGPANRGRIELELVEYDLVPQFADLLSDTCTCDGERLVSHVYAVWAVR